MEALRSLEGARVEEDFSLSRISWVGTKGYARWYVKPYTVEALAKVLLLVQERGLPFVVCGNCSNILWGDGFFDGIVIDTRGLKRWKIEEPLVIAEAGVRLGELVKDTCECGLSGLERLWGIPGTVGGAVVMNAGAYGACIGDLVEWVRVWREGTFLLLSRDELNFGYRSSNLKQCIVLEVALRLRKDDEVSKISLEEVKNARLARLPKGKNLGSVFKNGDTFFAGRVIEEMGFKGYSIGGVRVSERHANVFISEEGATASDYVRLINLVKSSALKQKGIRLVEEIVYAGSFV